MGGVEHREGSGAIGMEGGAWGKEWNILLFFITFSSHFNFYTFIIQFCYHYFSSH